MLAATNSTPVDVSDPGCQVIAFEADVAVTAFVDKMFTADDVDTDNSTVTLIAHGYTTGLAVTLTTDDTLPTGLSVDTTYYLIVVDEDTLAFATTYAHAIAGTKITITGAGMGNDTVAVTALSGATAQFQKSLDGVNWFNEGNTQNITDSGSILFSQINPECRFYQVAFTITSGQVVATIQILGKGMV